MYNKKNFGINLNFDSFGEAYDWPKDFKDDKAYTKGLDRITKLCQKLNIPITIFIIGKDLENKRNFEILQNFSKDNNIEIANHSYSHLFNFGSRNENIIYDEIYKSHELIFKCTNKEPKGFISPTWSVSANVIKNLIKLKYFYDTSFFKSVFLYPVVFKIVLSHIIGKKYNKAFQILNRRDYLIPFKYEYEPFLLNSEMQKVNKDDKQESIVEMPMPTISNLQCPIWHTMGYAFGFKYLKKKLESILKKNKPFFYLIHPADFLDETDMSSNYSLAIERMDKINYQDKINILEDVIKFIISNGYEGRKLIDIAKLYKN